MFKAYFLSFQFLIAINASLTAQTFYTKNGSISFFSKTPLEDINANSNEVVSLLNTKTGELQFAVLIKSFHFKKSLMEVHFNENYIESDKYPKAIFKGTIENFSNVPVSTNGDYAVTVSGNLTIHGVTKQIREKGIISVQDEKISASSKFKLKVSDFNIKIPGLVKDKIQEKIDVNVACLYNSKI